MALLATYHSDLGLIFVWMTWSTYGLASRWDGEVGHLRVDPVQGQVSVGVSLASWQNSPVTMLPYLMKSRLVPLVNTGLLRRTWGISLHSDLLATGQLASYFSSLGALTQLLRHSKVREFYQISFLNFIFYCGWTWQGVNRLEGSGSIVLARIIILIQFEAVWGWSAALFNSSAKSLLHCGLAAFGTWMIVGMWTLSASSKLGSSTSCSTTEKIYSTMFTF